MGGMRTGCTEATTNVFVEAAYFDPVRTARTGRRLRITSDARYRFERGVDPAFTPQGIELATRHDPRALRRRGRPRSRSPARCRAPRAATASIPAAWRGSSAWTIPEAEQVRILTALGFEIDGGAHGARSRPGGPTCRARPTSSRRSPASPRWPGSRAGRCSRPAGVARPILTPMQRREGQARRRIAALGFNECITYSFIDRAAAELFGGGDATMRLENPISSEMSHLRPDLLPGLLRAAARNQARGFADLALFEIGHVFPGGEPGEQALLATGLRIGATAPRTRHGTRRPVDLWDARADAEAALAAIGAPAGPDAAPRRPGLVPPRPLGRALARAEDSSSPPSASCTRASCRRSTSRGPAVAFTLRLEALPFPKAQSATRPPLEVSDLPAVERDFAFVLDDRVEAEAVLKAARAADKALIEAVSVFDVFAGPQAEAQMGPGKKSLAIAVRLQPTAATLTEAEIEAVSARVVAGVEKATGGRLRT